MSITEYINSKKSLELMPFMTVYLTIMELVKDGYIRVDDDMKMVKINEKL